MQLHKNCADYTLPVFGSDQKKVTMQNYFHDWLVFPNTGVAGGNRLGFSEYTLAGKGSFKNRDNTLLKKGGVLGLHNLKFK